VLVVHEGCGQHQGEERRGGLEDPRQPGRDVLLGPADQPERDRDVHGAEDGEVPQRPAIARHRGPRGDDHDEEDGEADDETPGHEAERRQRLDADLDEEVAGAPCEGEHAEQCRVGAAGAGRP
jgi:hypothetical protein